MTADELTRLGQEMEEGSHLRRIIALALAVQYTSPGHEDKPLEERLDQGMMRLYTAADGYVALTPVTPNQAAAMAYNAVEPYLSDVGRSSHKFVILTDWEHDLVKKAAQKNQELKAEVQRLQQKVHELTALASDTDRLRKDWVSERDRADKAEDALNRDTKEQE